VVQEVLLAKMSPQFRNALWFKKFSLLKCLTSSECIVDVVQGVLLAKMPSLFRNALWFKRFSLEL
jgi:hypothetical protein